MCTTVTHRPESRARCHHDHCPMAPACSRGQGVWAQCSCPKRCLHPVTSDDAPKRLCGDSSFLAHPVRLLHHGRWGQTHTPCPLLSLLTHTGPLTGQRRLLPSPAAPGHRTVTCVYTITVPTVNGHKPPWKCPDVFVFYYVFQCC